MAVGCIANRELYSDININNSMKSSSEESYRSYYTRLNIFLDSLSCSLLLFAVYVYYTMIPIKQSEDNCLLNVAGSLSLSHAAFLYDIISGESVLPDLCITNLYVMYYFTLCAFSWYALFMYYPWKKYKTAVSLDDAIVSKNFRIIGYGAPACLMILINIHAHASKLYSEHEFEFDCMSHQILIEDIYIFGPLILAVASNCYFWLSLDKHIETTPVKTTEDESNYKQINILLTLNRRLFLALALPWLAYVMMNGTSAMVESSLIGYLALFTELGTSCAGSIVALILVMSRARVWKCVTHKYENYGWLKKWQPSDQEEISTHFDNGSFNTSLVFPPDV